MDQRMQGTSAVAVSKGCCERRTSVSICQVDGCSMLDQLVHDIEKAVDVVNSRDQDEEYQACSVTETC